MAVRIPPRLFSPALLLTFSRVDGAATLHAAGKTLRPMSSSSSSSPSPSPYTTLKERATSKLEVKRSKFIALAAPISDVHSAHSFLSEVQDPRANHNCWAYKLGDQFRYHDDGEPSGTAGKPIYSAIVSSGIDKVMVVVIRYFGGIELGTGGLTRAYAGAASECLKGAATCVVTPKAPIGMEVPFDLLGVVYHQLQRFQAEDIKQDYDTGKDGITMVTFKVEYEKIESLENAINSACSRKIEFYKR